MPKRCPIYEIGTVFGKWTVSGPPLDNPIINRKGIAYECTCACGIKKLVMGTELRTGRNKQCVNCKENKPKVIDPKKHDAWGGLSW